MSQDDTAPYCPVCYEEYSEQDIELGEEQEGDSGRGCKRCITSQTCQHSLCHDCWLEYCIHSISDKAVPITCPIKGCNDVVPEEIVKFLLLGGAAEHNELPVTEGNSTAWETFERLERLAADPSLVECTQCQELNASSLGPDLVCEKCSHCFCQFHGDSHSGMTCTEYERTRDARRIKKSEKTLNQWTKPCSHCGARIQKWTGCNIVQCSSCKGVMCYRCGRHEQVQNHRCYNCETAFEARLCNCVALAPCLFLTAILLFGIPIYLLLSIAWVVLSFLNALLQGFFFCCCYKCGKDLPPEGKWAPMRGALAVVGLICLPFLTLPDAIVEARRGHGFLEDILHPSVTENKNDIPVYNGNEEDDDNNDEVDVEITAVDANQRTAVEANQGTAVDTNQGAVEEMINPRLEENN